MTTDPKDAEIARLKTELSNGSFYKEADIDAIMSRAEKAEAERDAALAQVAGAYEAAASLVVNGMGLVRERQDAIRALTPADALAARGRRDAQMRAEGRKEGLREAVEIADAKDPDKPTNYLHRRENIPAAILAVAEKGE